MQQERRFLLRVRIARIPEVMGEVVEDCSAKLVRPRLGEDFDPAKAEPVIFGRERTLIDANLANGIFRRKLAATEPVNEDRAATPAPQDDASSRPQSPRDLQSVIEKLPPLSLADLKPGDAVIISCTNNDDPSRVTAITLLSGVEPVLKTSSKGGQVLNLGSWNLDLNMNP